VKTLLHASLALAALAAGPAMAADLPVKAPILKAPPPVPIYGWTGCHIGGNGGWIGSRDGHDLTMAGAFLDPINSYSIPANRVGLEHSYQPSSSGGTAGVQAGCDYQVSRFVLGVEADTNWSGLRDSISAAYGPTTGIAGATAHTEIVSTDLKWFSTLRARAGFAWDRVQIYGTGGLAVARIDSGTVVQFANGFGFLGGFPFAGQASVDRWGWAAGAGIEYAAIHNWSFKVEYLHLDFGGFDYLSPCPNSICLPAVGQPPFAYNTHASVRDDMVRFGVNYKFGAPLIAGN
jgi:outer membrane immunogenic protein